MEIKFSKTAVPATVTRDAEPNPFDGQFPTKDGEALTFAMEGNADDKVNDAIVTKFTNLARKAAHKVDQSARVKHEVSGPKTKRVITFVIWSVPRITRPRTNGETQAAELAAVEEGAA